MFCKELMPIRRESTSPLGAMLFPTFQFSPGAMGSITNNYMTVEELREFMLNEQKVRH